MKVSIYISGGWRVLVVWMVGIECNSCHVFGGLWLGL
jgi:hypothetical protein